MATIPVKWFHGGMQGAPSIGNTTPGSLVAMLDACLVNGFNQLTLTSLSVSSEVATATRSAGHGYVIGQVIKIEGATPSSLNGEWRITSLPSASQFTFACPGISDGTATGTITAKAAPAGWVKEFSATNKAVYRSPNSSSPRSFYRFEDTGNIDVSVILKAYTGMTDIDTGENEWTYATQETRSWFKPKTGYGNSWMVFADDRTVYYFALCNNNSSGLLSGGLFYLGDYAPISPTDVEAELCQLSYGTVGPVYQRADVFVSNTPDNYSKTALRKNELGNFGGRGYGYRQINDSSGYGGPSFPSSVDGGMMLSNAWIREYGNNGHIRGRMRGSYWVLANAPFSATVVPGTDISGVAGLEGRTIHIIGPTWCLGGITYVQGRVAIDKTGPWS